ncbi:hypothetical protein C7S16_0743 [Burkholderia thailandensis]|uniref:Uncharacterized protein n=1 Tax=Burkholderia thailandensis TaxID=57975 RepID=A0AAW9D061_BURTH|nr:hypothetical protein [Burkholderia thailandensis]MDW9254743.1 hypothetical protein [Burkholderia thailandensis]
MNFRKRLASCTSLPGRHPDTERLSFFRIGRLRDLDQAKAANAPGDGRRPARATHASRRNRRNRRSRRMRPPMRLTQAALPSA